MSVKVTFHGNLTRDPEKREVGASTVVAFGVASQTRQRKADGSGYEANFFDVSVWGAKGDYVLEHAKKGTPVFISGDFCMMPYNAKDGTVKNSLRVTADTVDLLGARTGNPAAKATTAPAPAAEPAVDDALPF